MMRPLATAGAAIATAAALILLYSGLYGFALDAGYSRQVAYLYPLPVDALVATAYGAAYTLRARRGRVYAWALVVAGAAVSAWAQYLHAVDVGGAYPLAAVVPSVAAPAALHLCAVLARYEASATPVIAQVGEAPDVASAKPVVADRPRPAPAPQPTTSVPDDARVRELVDKAARVRKAPAGAIEELARLTGKSHATAKRMVATRRRALEAAA